jgi:DNA-binding transcriptional LysR family regulator
MKKLAVTRAGITFAVEESFAPAIARRELMPVLEDYCPYFPGFHLYSPGRRNLAPKSRALIEHVRRRER